MALSKLNSRLRTASAKLPEMLGMLRESRQFMKKISPTVYYLRWAGALSAGLAGLSVFTSIGLLLQNIPKETFQKYTDPSQITLPLLVIAVVSVMLYQLFRRSANAISQWYGEVFDERVRLVMERQVTDRLVSLDIGRLTDPAFIELKDRATGKRRRSADPALLLEKQQRYVGSIVGLTTALSVMMLLDPYFILLAILPVFGSAVMDLKHDTKTRELWKELHPLNRRADEFSGSLDAPARLLQGKLFRYVDYWLCQLYELQNEVLKREQKIRDWKLRFSFINVAIDALIFGVVAAYLGNGIISGAISIPQIVILLGTIRTASSSLLELSGSLIGIRHACLNYAIRQELLATKPLIDETSAETFRFPSTPALRLEGVSFRYPREDRVVLRDCTVTIRPGEKVAIVGQNGSGKTTILRLLAKVHLPSEGTVLVDGVPTSRIQQKCWLEQVLYATQDSGVPQFTLDEALTGSEPRRADMVRLRKAAEIAGIAQAIEALPKGYQTQLGGSWDDGWEPSAGQLQRLKITSALYRLLEAGVHIGLFDEPMSHCDIETRQHFYTALCSIARKTVVVVAHDPMYLNLFDRVLCVEDGRIVGDLDTKALIAAYQQEAIPRFQKEAPDRGHLKVVE